MKFEYGTYPSRSIRFATYPIRDILRPYVPIQVRYSLFKLLPYTTNVRLLRYLEGNSPSRVAINRVLFLVNLAWFFLTNIFLNIMLASVDCFEHYVLLKQALAFSLIMLAAVPFTFDSMHV
jgi:hypothetical protein